MKICTDINCELKGVEQPLENFSFRTDTKKYRENCKECRAKYFNSHYNNNKSNKKLYISKNKDKIQLYPSSEINYKREYNKQYNLINGRINNSGKSKPENHIEYVLNLNKIKYIYGYSFKDCKSLKNSLLQFDFYLPDLNLCIEYDGEFHYKPIFGKERLEQQQIYDGIKTQYCQQKRIKLIRISYLQDLGTELNNLLNKIIING